VGGDRALADQSTPARLLSRLRHHVHGIGTAAALQGGPRYGRDREAEQDQLRPERFARAVTGDVGKPVGHAGIGLSEQGLLLQFLHGIGDET
jgi:hypothetical protein